MQSHWRTYHYWSLVFGQPHLWDVTHLFYVGQRCNCSSSTALLTTNTTTQTQTTRIHWHMATHTQILTWACAHNLVIVWSLKRCWHVDTTDIGYITRLLIPFLNCRIAKNKEFNHSPRNGLTAWKQLPYNTPQVSVSLTLKCWTNTVLGFQGVILSNLFVITYFCLLLNVKMS